MQRRFSPIPLMPVLLCLASFSLTLPPYSFAKDIHKVSGKKSGHPLAVKAELAIKNKDYKEAVSMYRQVLDSPSAGNLDALTRIKMLERMCDCYVRLGKNGAAQRRCEQALTLLENTELNDPDYRYSLKALLADIFRRRRKFPQSEALWFEVIGFANSRKNAYTSKEYDRWRHGFLHLLLDTKKCREARQLASNLLAREEKRHGKNHESLIAFLRPLLNACTDCRDFDQAIEIFKRIMRLRSVSEKRNLTVQARDLNHLAWLYSLNGNNEEAIVIFRKSCQLAAKLPKSKVENVEIDQAANLLLAGCLSVTGKDDEAERYYRKALAVSDEHPELSLQTLINTKKFYIEFLHKQGRYKEAEVYERQLLQLLD